MSAIQWSPDGKFALFETGQRTETPQVARIDLVPAQPKYGEERFEELFKAETPAARGGRGAENAEKPPVKPVEIEFEHIRERISMLPIGLSVNQPEISPDGKLLLVSATVAGQPNLYLFPLEETASPRPRLAAGGGRAARVARQLTSTPGAKTRAQFSPDSREVYYLEGRAGDRPSRWIPAPPGRWR